MKKVLITGYTGFIGNSLLAKLAGTTCQIITLGRKPEEKTKFYPVDFELPFDCSEALNGVDLVLHCAARAHMMDGHHKGEQLVDMYREINFKATVNLAMQAANAKVKRFIFLSSIKVNGNATDLNKPFSEAVISQPSDPYGLSKYEAEIELMKIAKQTKMEVVIIRPPLVYGPYVKGNFLSILKAVEKEYPLPLGAINKNRRSFIALDNLVDFILLCSNYKKTPQAANQIFVISDDEGISTSELFHRLAKAYKKKNRIFPLPVWLLRLGMKVLGKHTMADKLLGSLQIDCTKAKTLLEWKPIITMDEQLQEMINAEKKSHF